MLKVLVSTILMFISLTAQASNSFNLLAKAKINYGTMVYSKGYAIDFNEFRAYGVNDLTARCWAWSGVPGQGGSSSAIQPGETVTVALDPQYNPAPERNMVFKMLRPDGQQFGGLTCAVSSTQPAPVSENDVRVFLQTQFGSSAEIK
jgi:hypothetical protein